MLFSWRSINLEEKMSRGQPQPRTSTAGRTLGRCTEKETTDSIVYIDVDLDDLSDVVVVDVPGSSQQRIRYGSKGSRNDKNFPSGNIISIDDDDDESPGNDGERGGGLESDTASSRASRCEPHQSLSSEDSDSQDCQFVQERSFPFKLSNKCKRMYSGKTIPRSIFTFNPLSEGGSSESDSSDCELMEGPYGHIRDQWERASTRKRTSEDISSSQSVVEEHASGSGSHRDNQKNVEVENEPEQDKKTPIHSDSGNNNNRKENSSFTASESILMDDSSPNLEEKNPFENLDSIAPGQESHSRSETQPQETLFPEYDHPWRGCFFSSQEQIDEQLYYENTLFNDKEEHAAAETFVSKNQSCNDSHSNDGKVSSQDKVDSSCDTHQSVQMQVGQDGYGYLGKNDGIHQEPSCSMQPPNGARYERANFQEKERPLSGDPSFCNIEPCFRVHVNCDPEEKNGQHGECISNAQSMDDPGINYHRFSCEDTSKFVADESLCNTQQDGTQIESERCVRDRAEHDSEFLLEGQLQGGKNHLLNTQDGNCMPDDPNDIINEREKIKETDEYKRAVEEEWASRRRELEIQAEEVRRLKKRKMRLLDMERRQKERVEEMRESQKRDEETINLKEQFRVEIRRELDRLERIHFDMASILRAFGIHLYAAYRRALLKFHPDRASKIDIRQQVEAEEKFKLVARLKEKFLPTF